ncbi:hypothetical protein F5I97DRAFT_1243966 [Phlebopus sp. FC_14]|nr:hypothetical protein F5I97DRAFT_1243966 [Phlebopus sp. FC_14]
MEGPQEAVKTTNRVVKSTIAEEETLVDFNLPQKTVEQGATTTDATANARRMTRSQTTGRPTIRWGKFGKEEDTDMEQKGSSSLKRTFDARAVDEETDVEAVQDPAYQPSKVARMEPTALLSSSSSATIVEEPEPPKTERASPPSRASPASGEYTFLDASSSSFTAERRGPRIRTAPPIPVPNLTKKSRGRRVPTADDAAAEGEAAEGKKGRVYVCKVEDCGKCFSRGEHLKRHIRSIHTHEKPFKCPHPSCDKCFNRNDNLLQHLRVHKGDNSSQTSVDSAAGPAGEESAQAESSTTATANASQRSSSKATSTARRATRPVRKTKSAASTPPIPAARLVAARVGHGLPISLSRTYSLPPLPSLTPSYHSPAAAGFMNNTNIAVSSLRTAIDESDGEPETEDTDGEARNRHDVRSLYSFPRDLGKDTFRDSGYTAREAGQSERRSDVIGESSNARELVASEEVVPAKLEPASSPEPSTARAATEEAGEPSSSVAHSAAPSPPPSAVST